MVDSADIGLESFFLHHPQEFKTKQALLKEKENKEKNGVAEEPLVVYLAQRMMLAGSAGLVYLKTLYTSEFLEKNAHLKPGVDAKKKKEMGGILWGSAVIALHDTFKDGYCDLSAFVDRINTSIGVKVLPPLTEEEKKKELLSSQQLKRMGQIADGDRTFTAFFTNVDLMPDNLKRYMERPELLSAIGQVIPDWKATAQPLVPTAA